MAEKTTKVAFTNTQAGPRGVHGVHGLVMIDPGQTITVEVTDAEGESAQETGYFTLGDADDALPSLSGLNKKQLLEIAEAEGVEIEDGATNAAITDAIEAKRAAAAAA